jgi:hypothetical protein
MDPTPLCSSPSVLQIYLVFNWSILNINVKTLLFFEFRFAAFPGKTIRLSITGKSPAILILAGGLLVSAKVGAHTRDKKTDSQMR